jgi:ribosomal protein S18 acetylase RimI-like enzyme
MIKRGGAVIVPGEVEEIVDTLPGVRRSAAVGVVSGPDALTEQLGVGAEVEHQLHAHARVELRQAITDGSRAAIGVGPAARGHGVGTALVEALLSWAGSRGAERVTVVTQGRNVAAQRLYQRCGFLTRSIHLWYHHWLAV